MTIGTKTSIKDWKIKQHFKKERNGEQEKKWKIR